jgi:hypothetical protein
MQRATSLIALALIACRPESTTPPTEPTPTQTPPVEEPPKETPPVEEPPAETPPAEEPPPPAEEPPPPQPYDLVVSFTSPGDGTDQAAYERLKTIVAKYKGIVQVRANWGREGEHDECFTLGELSPAKRKELIAKITASMKKSTKVTVTENAECKGTPEAAPQ